MVSGVFERVAFEHQDIFQANFVPYASVIPQCKAVVHRGELGLVHSAYEPSTTVNSTVR